MAYNGWQIWQTKNTNLGGHCGTVWMRLESLTLGKQLQARFSRKRYQPLLSTNRMMSSSSSFLLQANLAQLWWYVVARSFAQLHSVAFSKNQNTSGCSLSEEDASRKASLIAWLRLASEVLVLRHYIARRSLLKVSCMFPLWCWVVRTLSGWVTASQDCSGERVPGWEMEHWLKMWPSIFRPKVLAI